VQPRQAAGFGTPRETPTADLVFVPTLACRGVERAVAAANARHHRHPLGAVSAQSRPSALGRQGLLLSRTMLSNHWLPYVGRFACGWHRLATTDPSGPFFTLFLADLVAYVEALLITCVVGEVTRQLTHFVRMSTGSCCLKVTSSPPLAVS